MAASNDGPQLDRDPSGVDEERELERLARVDGVLSEIAERQRRGEPFDVDALLAKHADIAEELRSALPGALVLERVARESGVHEAPLPERIGEYVVTRELGRGGMGIVYEARDERLDRRVAVKLLPQRVTHDERYLERFRREAQAAARMQHPGIVGVFGVGEHRGVDGAPVHFYAMQYVEGVGLDRLLALLAWREGSGPAPHLRASERGSLEPLEQRLCAGVLAGTDSNASGIEPPSGRPVFGARYHRNVAHIVLQAAEAIAYAHSRGVLHRDLKPSNLLVDAEGRVLVTDFGLAKTEDSGDLTLEGDLVGTLRYMAPEQIDGHADPRSDVYGLGLVLYELLALRPAFDASARPRLVHDVLYTRPTRPRELRPQVPQDLDRIVRKATAKLPEERYARASELAADLHRWLEDRPIAARMPSAFYLARLAAARNRAVLITAAAALAFIVVGTLRYVAVLGEAREQQAEVARRASLAAAEASLALGEASSARRQLGGVGPDRRDWIWRHLFSRTDQSVATWAQFGDPVYECFFQGDTVLVPGATLVARVAASGVLARSDDVPSRGFTEGADLGGGACAVMDPNGRLWITGADAVRDLGTANGELFVDLESASLAVAATPDGERVVVGLYDGRVAIVDALTRSVLHSVSAHEGHVDGVTTVDDPNVAFSVATDGRLLRWDLAAGTFTELVRDRFPLVDVAATPDGSLVAVGGWSTSIELFDARTGALLGFLGGPSAAIYQLEMSSDGRWLAGGGEDGVVYVWDLERRGLHQRFVGHTQRVTSLTFEDATHRLVSASRAGFVKEWDIHSSGGTSVLFGHLADVPTLECSPNGRWVASGGRDGTVRIWDLEATTVRRVLVGHPGELNDVAWSADSRAIVGGDRAGYVTAWDGAAGERLWRARPSSQSIGGVDLAHSADECWVVHHAGSVTVLDATSGAEIATFEDVFDRVVDRGAIGIAVTPDERFVLVGTPAGEVVRIDRDARTIVQRAPVHGGSVRSLSISPDGALFASASLDRTVGLGAVQNLARAEVLPLEGESSSPETAGLEGVAFSPDGRLLAVASRSGSVRVVDCASREEVLRLPDHFSWVRAVDFTPDGRRLVSSGSDGTVRIWDDLTSSEKRSFARRHFEERERAQALAARLGVTFDDPRAAEREVAGLPLSDDQRQLLVGLAHQVLGARRGLLDECWAMALGPDATSESMASVRQVANASARVVQRDVESELLFAVAHLRLGEIDSARTRLERAKRVGHASDPRLFAVEARILEDSGDSMGAEAARAKVREILANQREIGPDGARARALLDLER